MLKHHEIDYLFEMAQAFAPHEMCGLLFDDGFHLTRNVAEDPTHAFKIDHQDYVMACMIHDGKPWAIVHSHPNRGAGASPKDCALMDALDVCRQDLAMVIVGLHPREIRCFRKRGDLYRCEWGHQAIGTGVPVG